MEVMTKSVNKFGLSTTKGMVGASSIPTGTPNSVVLR